MRCFFLTTDAPAGQLCGAAAGTPPVPTQQPIPGAHGAPSAEHRPLFLKKPWLVKRTVARSQTGKKFHPSSSALPNPSKECKYRNRSPLAQVLSACHSYGGVSGIYGVIFHSTPWE